jgi:hypothetical protein
MALAFYCLNALDLFGETNNLSGADKSGWVEWIWSQQICKRHVLADEIFGLRILQRDLMDQDSVQVQVLMYRVKALMYCVFTMSLII